MRVHGVGIRERDHSGRVRPLTGARSRGRGGGERTVLSNPGKRAIYDLYGLEGLAAGYELGPSLKTTAEAWFAMATAHPTPPCLTSRRASADAHMHVRCTQIRAEYERLKQLNELSEQQRSAASKVRLRACPAPCERVCNAPHTHVSWDAYSGEGSLGRVLGAPGRHQPCEPLLWRRRPTVRVSRASEDCPRVHLADTSGRCGGVSGTARGLRDIWSLLPEVRQVSVSQNIDVRGVAGQRAPAHAVAGD